MEYAIYKSNLKRSRDTPLPLTAKLNEYRTAIATPDGIVLEAGCAEGLTTQRLA